MTQARRIAPPGERRSGAPPPSIGLVAAALVLATAGGAACRRPAGTGSPPEARGVGWTMPDGSRVRRGVLISSASGREDPLVPLVAAAADGWAAACADHRGALARARFALDIPDAGAPTPAAPGDLASYERCLAELAASALSGPDLPRGTRLEIVLELR